MFCVGCGNEHSRSRVRSLLFSPRGHAAGIVLLRGHGEGAGVYPNWYTPGQVASSLKDPMGV